MSNVQLTHHGVLELTRLQGKFCECDTTIQVLLKDHPRDGEPIEEYNAIVSDATYCFPAIVDDFREELTPGINVVRATEVLCCLSPTGQRILIINGPHLVQTTPIPCFPRRVWSHNIDASMGNPLPIAALPYFPEIEQIPRIRVLVTYKSVLDDPRGGSGDPMFIVHLLDESDEVRAYAKNQVAFELYDKLEIGKAYYITNLECHRGVNEFFFNLSSSGSLKLTRYTIIEDCHDSGVPKLRFDFTLLPELRTCELKNTNRRLDKFTYVDVIGIVHTVGTLEEVLTACYSKQLPKKNVTIFDQSGQALSVMLWSYNAEHFRARPGTIVAFRHARLLEEYSELPSPGRETLRLLSVVTTSTVHIEPDVEECFALRQWYASRPGPPAAPSSQTTEVTLCEPCS